MDINPKGKGIQENGFRLVSKMRGHSYEKFSFGDSRSIILDLKELVEFQVESNSKFAYVRVGNKLGNVHKKLLGTGK